MKHYVIAIGAVCMASLTLNAQKSTINNSRSNIKNNISFNNDRGKWKCTMLDKSPCTAAHLQELSAALTSESGIKSLALAADGTLVCKAVDGTPCTDAQFTALNTDLKNSRAAQTAGGSTPAAQGATSSLNLPDPNSKVLCDRSPCTPEQLKNVNAALQKMGLKSNPAVGADGTATCAGKACTEAQFGELNKALATMVCVGCPIKGVSVGLGKKPTSK